MSIAMKERFIAAGLNGVEANKKDLLQRVEGAEYPEQPPTSRSNDEVPSTQVNQRGNLSCRRRSHSWNQCLEFTNSHDEADSEDS